MENLDYTQNGGNKKSLKGIKKSMKEITIKDVTSIISENKNILNYKRGFKYS